MKKIKKVKIKRLVANKKAVSSVVGAMLMLAIVISIVPVFGIAFTNFMTAQKEVIDSQVDMMYRFIDFLDSLNFSLNESGNSSDNCSLPDTEYRWNETTLDWEIFIWWEEHLTWIRIYPPYLDGEGIPIWPPEEPGGEQGETPGGGGGST